MALIHCTKCGEEISDKAISCPHCNFALSKQNIVKCEECGIEYESNLSACPKCGCPKTSITEKTQKNKHKGIIISIISVALIAVCMLGFSITQKAKGSEYYSNMETVSYTMLDGAAKAETAGNLIKSVWFNAIDEERDAETDKYTMKNDKFVYDFNAALNNLFSDEEFQKNILAIQKNQDEVISLMKQLNNPPKEYAEAYSVLKTYYDNYLSMTNMVINPSDSLQSFSNKFNNADTETVNSYEKMKLYLK